MRIRLSNILAILLVAIVIFGCSKKDTAPITPPVDPVVTDPPKITILSIYQGKPRQIIEIAGELFLDVQGSSYVEVNGVKATSYPVWTNKKIQFRVPEGATSGKLKVVVATKSSNEVDFTVLADKHYLDMVEIQAGTFVMGKNGDDYADPAHTVQITKPFMLAKYETSQKLYQFILWYKGNPSKNFGELLPVERANWITACLFCNELSKLENYDTCYVITPDSVIFNFKANGYRLPTEAEWEYACRAGTTGNYAAADVSSISWNNTNADNTTHQIGTKEPNKWGLYDMHGNVAEWVWDIFDGDYFSLFKGTPAIDPKGPDSANPPERLYRGGSYQSYDNGLPSWSRNSMNMNNANYDLGFRVARNK